MDEKTKEALRLARDIFRDPQKYNLTAEQIHQWALDHINGTACIIGKIPESLQDELADALVEAYKEKQRGDKVVQDLPPCNTASPTQQVLCDGEVP